MAQNCQQLFVSVTGHKIVYVDRCNGVGLEQMVMVVSGLTVLGPVCQHWGQCW